MTKLAVLADIHGNLPALEAIIADMTQFSVDAVVVAGDTISCGPFSKQVLERVIACGWAVIRGNHEFYLLDHGTLRQPVDRNHFTLPPYLVDELGPYWRNIIATLPDTLSLQFPDAPPVRVVHSTYRSHFDTIFPQTSAEDMVTMFAGVKENTIIHGHNHLQYERRVNGWHVINPGSAGLPLDGTRKANYTILEGNTDGWIPHFRRVEFDYAPIFAEFERQQYVERHGVFGYFMIEEFKTARTWVAPYYRWHKVHYPNEPYSLERAKEFKDSGTLKQYSSPAFAAFME